ncbi:hypothetical protein HanHA300_Chr11g0412311 [Helianthus annuus]|nr:hypothetical protein HanHA300_Chr11g0412311 [Helianthus annuus]KAJ0510420.1 hypothetical protein HanIR_Chr11g0540621 [Helianthus annuus]KAJ0518306.1 hypothetical protein HanHA89_Chr11g0435971 [Helianthus annuus]KAJ0686340.1 hypothetical protein HanLR1_Chr11g0413651 [Helianthus annuus]KAJ0690162.1 hypothetical protein HanOQP8_Chr11g0414761 [Helianthus annuus]
MQETIGTWNVFSCLTRIKSKTNRQVAFKEADPLNKHPSTIGFHTVLSNIVGPNQESSRSTLRNIINLLLCTTF